MSRRRIDRVWLVLCGLTLLAWLLSRVLGHDGRAGGAETVVVLAVAAVKARLVVRDYMEVRHAPRRLRWLTDAWLGGLLVVLLGTYFAA